MNQLPMNQEERKHIREEMTRGYLEMLPEALEALRDIINDPDINPIARVQAIGLVMDRGLGKPEENIRIQHAEESMDEAQERLDDIFAQVQRKMDENRADE